MQKKYFVMGAILMALAVGLGAFGAHILSSLLSAKALETFKTGVHYHMIHAIGILVTTLVAAQWGTDNKKLLWANRLFLSGIILFSGSLYGLSLTGARWFGPITPLGGVSFITGWLMFAFAIIQNK
ncbi:uncharacterized membrane protein YgdD (TMEM256/DUF423 family) [Paenibacillus turicensis]|uniref:Uncharacterized membrane protein YgdD (TMEM256/DUF423 family) n=1 Tax=Paenibacillus turicensis TaxID=160487 RepID=A0ABS4FRT1_9BACL|nr:DUF423 domain-containing protein [Paenibacillus turicensis]MBP1905288.1 uncharacterized membrane protein YgdD (TMEM256/DUF423 family) [Paenibacillus turicensis]